ncbi:cupin domain-containing protein [Streptomyces griseofuscus]|uniref:cupin domain-containing protein n=1 Tax=Streptomyces TaxID=1883 RepID=UPI0018F07D0F|nr:cupin domain-containing protein [Streptomyces sp. CRPSP2-6A1]MBJ7002384.1 cupin domain-containing protein [Streptomyces sp. CRPSP2-6A1]
MITETDSRADRQRPLVEQNLPVFQTIPGHYDQTPFFLTKEMLGGQPIEIAGGEISDKVGKPVAAPHTHEVPEIYVLMSPEPGGAVIEVVADDETYELVSPAVMLIPAGTVHHFVTKRAQPGSYCLGVLLTGDKSVDLG